MKIDKITFREITINQIGSIKNCIGKIKWLEEKVFLAFNWSVPGPNVENYLMKQSKKMYD